MKRDYKIEAKKLLEARGVRMIDMAELLLEIQKDYIEGLKIDACLEMIDKVLEKREVQFAIITGIEIDKLAEKGLVSDVLADLVLNDFGLYGIDEVLALSICNVYGSIGFTNFGYLDKAKPGIIREIDNKGKEPGKCNTFLDDIVCAIVAAAASRLAHSKFE